MNNNQSEKINLKIPVPGEIFSNEKGQKYQIVTVAKHVVTKETLVIYQALYGDFDMRVQVMSPLSAPLYRLFISLPVRATEP